MRVAEETSNRKHLLAQAESPRVANDWNAND
jgi:hypothetical protein